MEKRRSLLGDLDRSVPWSTRRVSSKFQPGVGAAKTRAIQEEVTTEDGAVHGSKGG